MRALRPSLAGMATICLLTGLSVVAWAQDEVPAPPTPVSGTVTEAWGFSNHPGYEETYLDGLLVGRGYVEHQEIAWTDPRLPSTHWIRMDYVVQGTDESDAVVTIASSHLLLGEEGAWRGTGRALEWDDERTATYELVGEGAYEGLYLLLQRAPGPDDHGLWDYTYEGYLFEGMLPPYPRRPNRSWTSRASSTCPSRSSRAAAPTKRVADPDPTDAWVPQRRSSGHRKEGPHGRYRGRAPRGDGHHRLDPGGDVPVGHLAGMVEPAASIGRRGEVLDPGLQSV